MRLFSLGLVFVLASQAAIQNVKVVGVTATQAIVSYQAPDLYPCKHLQIESSRLVR